MSAMPAIDEKFSSVVEQLVPLNQLSLARRQQLLARAEVLSFRRGAYIFREGERDGWAYYLLAGQVELYSGQQLVKSLTGGNHHTGGNGMQICPRRPIEHAGTRHAIEAKMAAVINRPISRFGINQPIDERIFVERHRKPIDRQQRRCGCNQSRAHGKPLRFG